MSYIKASITSNILSFTADICCLINEYCDDTGNSNLVVTSFILHRVKNSEEFIISAEGGNIKITSGDSVVQFARKVADVLIAYAVIHDVNVEKMAEAIWYASTRVYFEDVYTRQYKELLELEKGEPSE